MASNCRLLVRLLSRRSARSLRHVQTTTSQATQHSTQSVRVKLVAVSAAAASAVVGYVAYKAVSPTSPAAFPVSTAKTAGTAAEPGKSLGTRLREMTFLNFASLEYDGNIYMTPDDFLQSIIDDKPRLRAERRHVREVEVEKWLRVTPSKSKASSHLFRNLGGKGIISYTEYLFLLCVLTKPQSGFSIAFNMFDTDGDQRVDKKEFLVLMALYMLGRKDVSRSAIANTDAVLMTRRPNLWTLLKVQHAIDDSAADDRAVETTLTTHFFGSRGKDVLTYEDFHRFMDNLQTEVLEMEFNEYSHGSSTIHEQDFARILLRYTTLTKQAHSQYLDRLAKRIPHSQGITFTEFKEFCQFLNNLDDFALAMRIYTYASQPISEGDFRRAVKACTGQLLNSHVVHVVFQLFDADGDGKLSHKEFVAVMKDRLLRGTQMANQTMWESYKTCLKNEVRSS